MSQRVYQFEPARKLPVDVIDIGHHAEVSGILYQGSGDNLLLLLPGADIDAVMYGGLLVYTPTEAEWAAIVKSTDDPKYLDALRKIWLRKAQRVISGKVQQIIWRRDGFRCMYCDRQMGDVQLTIDHFVPLDQGGENNEHNYVSACRKCNLEKGNTSPREWCARNGLDFDWFIKYLDG